MRGHDIRPSESACAWLGLEAGGDDGASQPGAPHSLGALTDWKNRGGISIINGFTQLEFHWVECETIVKTKAHTTENGRRARLQDITI